MNRIAIPAFALAALLGLSACGAAAESATQATAAPATESQAATAPPAAAPAAPAPEPTENHKSNLIVKFGEKITYDDKISVTVKHAGTAVASEYAAPEAARGAEVQIFNITLTNGGEDTYEPAGFYETAVYGKAGTEASKVFDGGNATTGNFTGVMLPGATQTITIVLLVPKAELKTLVLSVQPTWEHKAAVVTGGL